LRIRQAVIYHLKSGLLDDFFFFFSACYCFCPYQLGLCFCCGGLFLLEFVPIRRYNSLVVDGNTGQSWDCLEPPLRLFCSSILYPNDLCIYQQEINGV
jgi:hypothetical protein